VSKEPQDREDRGEDMSLIAGSAYKSLPNEYSNNPRSPLDLNIIRLSESNIE